MHLAYRESTPFNIRAMYHQLACNGIRGPKIRIEIPKSMTIQDKHDILPALDRLKNYDRKDLDLNKFDAMFTNTYTPDSMSTQDECSVLAEQMSYLNEMTTESCDRLFDASINDADIPDEAMKSLQTRDVLKQIIEESCTAADYRGVKGRRALEERLLEFRRWCNENPPDEDDRDNGEKNCDDNISTDASGCKRKSKYFPMTQTKYVSGIDIIHNTAHMG